MAVVINKRSFMFRSLGFFGLVHRRKITLWGPALFQATRCRGAGRGPPKRRVASRVGQDAPQPMLLLILRGTPTLYCGDEIGTQQVAMLPIGSETPSRRTFRGSGIAKARRLWRRWTCAATRAPLLTAPPIAFPSHWLRSRRRCRCVSADSPVRRRDTSGIHMLRARGCACHFCRNGCDLPPAD